MKSSPGKLPGYWNNRWTDLARTAACRNSTYSCQSSSRNKWKPDATHVGSSVPASQSAAAPVASFVHRAAILLPANPFPCALRSEEHTSELQSHLNLVCRLLLEKKKKKISRA